MKIGIVSDIHGNLQGLNLALKNLESHGCGRLVCLGDLVDGGEYNTEVVDLIRSLRITCVRGNHDEINTAMLSGDRQEWLNSLPEEVVESGICFTHISPRPKRRRKINSSTEAWNAFDETDYRITFVGHTHVSAIYMYSNNVISECIEVPIQFNTFSQLDPMKRYVISPGAIGYSRDGRKTIRCAIYDDVKCQINISEIVGPTIL